jgi:hypothetical protein
MYDEIEVTTTRIIKSEFPIRRIYEYEENIEVLITNSKPKEIDQYIEELESPVIDTRKSLN